MKTIKIALLLSCFAFILSACSTDLDDPAGPRNKASVPGIENLNPATYDVNDLENTYIQFDLVADPAEVDAVNLLVSFNGDKARSKVAEISTFPSNIKVPLAEAASALGMDLQDIEAADRFNFEVQTSQNGETFFSSAAFNAAVVCGYDLDNITGSYRAYSGPDEWDMEGNVTLEADPNDEFTIYIHGYATAEGLVETGPLVLKINPLDFSVTVLKSTIATNAFGYTGYTYEGSGSLNTCDGTFELKMDITVDQGSFGSFEFEFTKN